MVKTKSISTVMSIKQTNHDFIYLYGPLTLGPTGASITIDNIALPSPPTTCTRYYLQSPICRSKLGVRNIKMCDDCHLHAEHRKKFIKSQGGMKAMKLRWENRILRQEWLKVKSIHSNTILDSEYARKAVAEIKETLVVKRWLFCQCPKPCPSKCICLWKLPCFMGLQLS